MAWYSYTLAMVLPPDRLDPAVAPKDLLAKQADLKLMVHTASRSGALLEVLRNIWRAARRSDALYLLAEEAVLNGADVQRAISQIEALLAEIEASPRIVLEATKDAYSPATMVRAEGFEPLHAQLVYPDSATVEDGWVYFYTEAQVREKLSTALISDNPCPAHDDDGQSLEYVFGFLKSHLALLRHANQNDHSLVYAELNTT